MKQKKKRRTIIILIVLMLLLIAASLGWIYNRSAAVREAQKSEQELAASEEAAAEEEKAKAEEEAAARAAEEAKIASHVYSYRGKEGAEEHSFKAYDEAIEAGSQYIGVDVVVSSDGIAYVSSELNAVVMTGYNGMYEYIDSETIDSLTTDAGNKVLRLSEVFEKYGSDIHYVIELKADSDACIDAFEKAVDDSGLADAVIVASRHLDVLEKLEGKYPDMTKLCICWSQGDVAGGLDESYVDILSVRAEVETGIMTQANCDAAHAHDKLFSAWTIDTEDDIKRAIDMGVDSYFTNDTPLALKLEREYGYEGGRRK